MGSRREDAAPVWANEVRLVGRVSAEPEQRELPSGDLVTLFRLVVPRADPPRPRRREGPASTRAKGPTAATVDTIDIACWSGRARRGAARLRPGDCAEVAGALRRRFFRVGGVAASRYEVDASEVRRARPG
jgi:single-strand DNA-binding protein